MRILYFVLYLNFISINCSNKLLDLCSCKRSLYLHIDCIIIAEKGRCICETHCLRTNFNYTIKNRKKVTCGQLTITMQYAQNRAKENDNN